MTEAPAAASPSFARRFSGLLGRAGWRVALHVLPYAMAAGTITEGILRLRISTLWKLPLVLVVIACLHLGVLLGAHVAALRVAVGRGAQLPPVSHHLRVAGRITGESATMLLIVLIGALALVGLLDIAVTAIDPALGASWPGIVLRMIATFTTLSVMAVLLTGAAALAASSTGHRVGFAAAARALLVRSDRATVVLCTVIAMGVVATLVAALAARAFDISPPLLGSALAKAFGYLAAVTTLSVGAAAMSAADETSGAAGFSRAACGADG